MLFFILIFFQAKSSLYCNISCVPPVCFPQKNKQNALRKIRLLTLVILYFSMSGFLKKFHVVYKCIHFKIIIHKQKQCKV